MTVSSNHTSSVSSAAVSRDWHGNKSNRVLRRMARIATICLAIYWVAIFAGTHLPGSNLPQVTVSDKMAHALAYLGLSFLLAWALPTLGKSLKHVSWAAAIAVAYGCVDELTQLFVPSRSCDIEDLAADCIGIVVGLSAYLLLRQLLLQVAWGRNLLCSLSR